MSTPDKTEAEKRQSLRKIINDSHTAFLVTRSVDGRPHGRPMANAEVDEDLRRIYFATQRSSGKVDELNVDDRVFLGYVNGSGAEWASITGRGRIVDDRALIRELWNPMWKNWFTGPEDPEITLIEVTPEQAEYWDAGSRLVQMAKFAFTALTGKAVDEGEHAKVALTGSGRV